MIGAMRSLALDYLLGELEPQAVPEDLNAWYRELRSKSLETLFPYLVESTDGIDKVYIISRPPGGEFATLTVRDMRPEIASHLPFVKPPGSQDAQVGPIIKHSYTKGKGAGPSAKILNTTVASFRATAEKAKPWSPYFREIVEILDSEKIQLPDGSMLDWRTSGSESLLEGVVRAIGDAKARVLIAVGDSAGNLPARRREYVEYLMSEKLAGDRYVTEKAGPAQGAACPLCGQSNVVVYPNALKGAGINFKNVDREGAFPGLDVGAAWKGYSLCGACADLLYIYKNHVLKKVGPRRDVRPFTAKVAGEPALVVPFCTGEVRRRRRLLREVAQLVKAIPEDVGENEEDLLDLLKDEESVLNLHFLWADIGQEIDNVRGTLADVPPSRLRELSNFNRLSKDWEHPLFPGVRGLSGRDDLSADLSLKALSPLFRRPGGKKAQGANDSKRLFQLKRAVATAVYHKRPIPERRFWDELMLTAQSYILEVMRSSNTYWGLLSEGEGKRGPFLTAAGWIRHVAWWLYYFRCLEVMEMADFFFEPRMEGLKPFFGPESGIDTPEKAYAFLMGILYGKLLAVQGARGVDVASNALAWLRRLSLKGRDLPELYVKIRGKLLAYGSEKSSKLRDLIEEIGMLGVRLGDCIELSQTQTSYYLLLGQSMTKTVLKKEDGNQGGGENDN